MQKIQKSKVKGQRSHILLGGGLVGVLVGVLVALLVPARIRGSSKWWQTNEKLTIWSQVASDHPNPKPAQNSKEKAGNFHSYSKYCNNKYYGIIKLLYPIFLKPIK